MQVTKPAASDMPWNIRTGSFAASGFNFAILLFAISSSVHFLPCATQCTEGAPCYPSPKDIAAGRNITVNSTCGDPAEQFCIELNCESVCNANDNDLKHPASYINDDYNLGTYWKSKNFEYPVFMQLDLGAIYMLFNSIVTFQHDYHLPAAMHFAKSKDFGASFQPIAYFSTSCSQFYNMTETSLNRRSGLQLECFKMDTTANPNPTNRLRQVEYSPLRDSATAALLFNNITSAEMVSKFFLTTNIRVMLERFIMPPGITTDTVSASMRRGLYFSVKDWDVRVACYCYGQASKCESDNSPNCVCERNTLGPHCNECLPLYNNRTWEFGRPCEACGCNSHASNCQFNSTKGYGVCINCSHNTMGEKCDACKPYYYRNSAVAIDHNQTCLACACNASGITDAPNSGLCNGVTGQCACKPSVEGRTCGSCKTGYWNLSSLNPQGCQECGCVTAGTVNNSNVCDGETGQCRCKPAITGQHCTRCKDGYFGLTQDNPSSCTKCACSLVGSVNISCNSTGGCYCRHNFYGLKCDQIQTGFYVPSVGQLTYEAEDAEISPPQEKRVNYTHITDTAGRNILVVGVVLSAGANSATPTKLTFLVGVPGTGVYSSVLRFMTSSSWKMVRMVSLLRTNFSSFSCDGTTVHTTNEPTIMFTNVTAGSEFATFGSGGQCMLKGTYRIVVEIPYGSGDSVDAQITVDSIVVLPYISQWPVFKSATTEERQNMTFYHRQAGGLRQWSGSSAVGSRVLAPFYGSLYGEAQACSCSFTGSQSLLCDEYGGQCTCKANVIGRQCNKCQPDHYNFTSGAGCRACSCNMIGTNRTSCDLTSGQCSCHDGVTGRTCNTCKQYYYNFNSGVGCSPCNCNASYSQDLQCNRTGECTCKLGVSEDKCTRCADNYYNLTTSGCSACNCKSSGSLGPLCNKTNGQCPCKPHAESRRCNMCPYGYYGLNSLNPAGCLKCQCSRKSANCSMDNGWVLTAAKTRLLVTEDRTKMDGWKIVNQDGSQISVADYYWDVCTDLDLASLTQGCIVSTDTGAHTELYFSAPTKYLGDKRFAYTYSMSFLLQHDNFTSRQNSTKGDVILTGKLFNQVLVTSFSRAPGTKFTKFEVQFIESQWRVGNTTGRQPTSDEMVAVLSSLTAIHIRSKWTTETGKKSRITDIEFYFSNRTTVLGRKENTTNVERCQCPQQYTGQFCEQCATGYTRATPNGGAYIACVPCKCNGHSPYCHSETGVCLECQHNTTGDHCELCADGLYGNATHGTPQDCKKCPCPGSPVSANQFARTCSLAADDQPTCNCFEGYEGRRCDVCADSYYGKPWEAGGSCRKCDCSGNIDVSLLGNCNRTTGECLKCTHNTTGFNCQWCEAGYHGNALTKSCQKCNCTAMGSEDNVCHNVTGQCKCWPNVVGLTCGQCGVNAFNYTSGRGCTECSCHPQGAILQQCNETTGDCSCRTNVTGRKCDSCNKGYYDVSKKCIECNCHANQTQPGTTCDVVTGQCVCNMSRGGGRYGGRRCEGCALHTTGKSPYCKSCTEQCYFNWWKLINKESQAVSLLEKNVTDLLQAFGGMSRKDINITLQQLDRNLSYASQVFGGAQYNLGEKTAQLDRIRASISRYQEQLNTSQQILTEAQLYLTTVVDKFNGTVEVIPMDPNQLPSAPNVQPGSGGTGVKVYADHEVIVSMATSYRRLAYGHNASGYEAYGKIMTSYQMISLANTTAAIAARRIQEAMAKLPEVDAQRRVAETNLGPSFQSSLAASRQRLDEISRVTQEIVRLMQKASATGQQAKEMVDSAQSTVNTAKATATQRRTEAAQAVHNATVAHQKSLVAQNHALEAQGNATEFKSNATGVLSQAQSSLDKVVEGINRVAKVTNTTVEANTISETVQSMRLPVTLQEIQRLASEINNTQVNETAINITYEGTSAGLAQARAVEQLSKKAINVSQSTLNTVKGIESSLKESKSHVEEARSLQGDTDRMAREIHNITKTVQSQFSAATSVGEQTLRLINSTIESVDEGLTCFSRAKEVAQNASDTASKAHNVSQEAKKTYEDNNKKMPNASRRVDEAYNSARGAFTEVEATHANATKLLHDVMEAEVLLKSYIEQRDEMIRLKTESEDLEKELDNVTNQFEQAIDKYNNCNNA